MFQELCRTVRALLRVPHVTVAAIILLGIAAGTTTAVFSVVDSVLLRPLPYRDAEQLVDVFTRENLEQLLGRSTYFRGVQSDGADDMRAMADLFEAFSGYEEPREASVERDGQSEPGAVGRLGLGLLDVFGLSPVAGREFTVENQRAADVAIIGEGYWRRAFGGREDAVGRVLTIGQRHYRVVGVAPTSLRFGVGGAPGAIAGTEVWLPLQAEAPGRIVPLVGRLRPREQRRAARGLQAAQIALTIVLATVFLALLGRFVTLTRVDLGYRAAGLSYLTFESDARDGAAASAFMETMRSRVEALPGVERVLVAGVPASGHFSDRIRTEGLEQPGALAAVYRVPQEYFAVCGIPIRRGVVPSGFADAVSQAVISQSLAGRLWPGDDPIGKVLVVASASLAILPACRLAMRTDGARLLSE